MAQTLSGFDTALKIDYLPVIRKQLNESTVLLNKVQRNERDVSGKQWQLTAHYQRNSGVGAGSETGLPTAGQQAYVNPYGVVKYNRARIQVSGPVIAASKNDKGAMVRALESEMQGAVRDLKKEINYQLFNDGTAVRALVNGDPGTAATLTLDGPGTQWFHDGMKIDILNPSDGVPRTSSSGLTVNTVNSTTTLTLSAGANSAVADNDWVTRAGATNLTGTSYEMMGLKGIVDDATYVTTLHGLSRTTYPWWKCTTYSADDNSGTLRDLSLTLIQNAITAVEKNGDSVNMIISGPDLRDSYVALLVSDKRYVNTLSLDGGWRAIEYSSGGSAIPWVADPDCQPNTIFFINTERLQLMQMSDFSWMDRDGAVLSRVANSDAYEAVMYWYSDLATDRPRSHTFLRDVQ